MAKINYVWKIKDIKNKTTGPGRSTFDTQHKNCFIYLTQIYAQPQPVPKILAKLYSYEDTAQIANNFFRKHSRQLNGSKYTVNKQPSPTTKSIAKFNTPRSGRKIQTLFQNIGE